MNKQIVSKPNHGQAIGKAENLPIPLSPEFQNFFDDLEEKLNTNLLGEVVRKPIYTVAELPDATLYEGGELYVSDESGGATPAFSDGTNWRRDWDLAVVS